MRVFMVWYAAGNAFARAKALGLVDEKTTTWEFQWDILKQRYCSGAEFNNTKQTTAVRTAHAPKRFASHLLVHALLQREYAFGVRSVRQAHAHQVLRGRPRSVVCHGCGGAARDGQGGLCHPYPWDQCEPWWNNGVGWVPSCEDAPPPPPTVVLCYTTRCARRTRCAHIASVALNVPDHTNCSTRSGRCARRRTFFSIHPERLEHFMCLSSQMMSP